MTQMRKNLHLFKQHTLEIWTIISQKNKSTNTSGSFESASEKKELSIKNFFFKSDRFQKLHSLSSLLKTKSQWNKFFYHYISVLYKMKKFNNKL